MRCPDCERIATEDEDYCPECGRVLKYLWELERAKKRRFEEIRNMPHDPTLDPCWITTAVYGSPLAPEIGDFKAFRDRFVARTSTGRLLIRLYYATSPPIAICLARRKTLRLFMRIMLEVVRRRIVK